jgi:hypothetical protein
MVACCLCYPSSGVLLFASLVDCYLCYPSSGVFLFASLVDCYLCYPSSGVLLFGRLVDCYLCYPSSSPKVYLVTVYKTVRRYITKRLSLILIFFVVRDVCFWKCLVVMPLIVIFCNSRLFSVPCACDSRVSSVGITTRYGLDSRGLILGRSKKFLSVPQRPDRLL